MTRRLLRSRGLVEALAVEGLEQQEIKVPSVKATEDFANWLLTEVNKAIGQMAPKFDSIQVELRQFGVPFGTLNIQKLGKKKFRVRVNGSDISLQFLVESQNHNAKETQASENEALLDQVRSVESNRYLELWLNVTKAGAVGLG
jgi:hypothetical protein